MRAQSLFLSLFALFIAVGCGGAVTSNGIARIRGLNAVTTPSQIDIFSDFNVIGLGLGASQVSGYSLQQAQVLSIGFRQSGTTSTISSVSFEPDASTNYTAIVFATGASTYGIFVLQDSTPAPAANKFKLRLAHFDRLLNGVDVYYTNPDTDLTTETPIITNITYQDASAYVELPAALAKQIRVTQTGTTNVIGGSINLTAPVGATQTILLRDASGATLNLYADN